jgi:glycosyltransferase involved in cell wall biosynthesis
MTTECVSIILPVYNEEGNIAACLRGLTRALQGVTHEILVCYDFDEDTTLSAIARMEDKPAALKLVRNTLGRGAAAAIRAGFQSACGDVLVTTMADLSDPPEVIREMASKIREEGADVVSGSRYMKGGSQTGGPRLKTLLSKAAGLSLRWVAGLGTHDATTNFRAYSRKYIEKARIQSKYGMELALELTVQAHLNGFRVDEVPSSWQDRSAGESRFQLWKWMPRYLRWYLAAMADPLFAWTVLLGASIAALWFAVRHAPPLPYVDEWFYIPLLAGRESLSLEWLWAQHNEHRIPLAKLIWFGLERCSGVDARWGVVANVLLLTASSVVLILALRRFRGQSAWTDAFVPLLFLHWDHWENLTWPFQIAFTLHHVMLSILIAVILDLNRSSRSKRALPFGLCLVAFSLVGSSALPFILLIAPWWSWMALRARPRIRPWISVGLPALALLIGAVQLLSFHRPEGHPSSPGLWTSAMVALEVLAGSVGFKGTRNWPASGWLTAVALAAALAMLLRESRRQLPARGLLTALGGLLVLSFLVGHSRAGFTRFAGFFERYVTLSCFLPLIVYVTAEYLWPDLVRRLVRTALLLFMAFLYEANGAHALDLMIQRRLAEQSLARDVNAGVPVSILARRHLYWYVETRKPDDYERDLRMLAEERKAIFRKTPLPDSAIRWNGGAVSLRDGRVAFELPRDAFFSPDLQPGTHHVRIDFGRLLLSMEEARFRAVVHRGAKSERVWSSSFTQPAAQGDNFDVTMKEGDRLQFELEAPAAARYWVLLEFRRP